MERAVGAALAGVGGWAGGGDGGGLHYTHADRDPPCSACFFSISSLLTLLPSRPTE